MNCLNCNTQTNNPKFCSRSCAATYNNKIHPKRQPIGVCKECRGPCRSGWVYCTSKCRQIRAKRIAKSKLAIDRIDQKCVDCHISLTLANAYRKGKDNNVLQSYCKNCLHKRQMYRWKKRKEEAIKYKGGICEDCDGIFPPEVYQFHHRTDDKEFSWAKGRLYSWDRVIKEIDKCALLCANCHVLRHSKSIDEYKPPT